MIDDEGNGKVFVAPNNPLTILLPLKSIAMLTKMMQWLKRRFSPPAKNARSGFKDENPFLIL